MPHHIPWRAVTVGLVGASVAGLMTFLFDLRVHAGVETVTGPMRYLVAGLCGGLCAVLADRAMRENWPFW